MADRAFGSFLTSDDLPNPNSRVLVRGEDIVMDWQRFNMDIHHMLIKRTRQVMRRAFRWRWRASSAARPLRINAALRGLAQIRAARS